MIVLDMFLILLAAGLLLLAINLYRLASTSKAFQKKLIRFYYAIHAPDTVSAQIKDSEFDMHDANVAASILLASYPHDETEVLQGAAGNLRVSVRKTVPIKKKLSDWFGEFANINLYLYYDVTLPLQGFSFTVRQANATFTIQLEELKNPCKPSPDYPDGIRTSLRARYIWKGADTAISDMFSVDYKILHYLIKRTEMELEARGFKKLARPAPALAGRQRKAGASKQAPEEQWMRSFEATGGRSYSFWPTPEAYSEAVQNPSHSFKDENLQRSEVALNAIGLPRVQSGMFASVYEFNNEHEQWAVRCFTTRLIDQQERYKAISSFILSDDLSYTVDFHYLEDGIKCGDSWFPVLKMVWVEGQPLDIYIREHLKKPEALQRLKAEFQTMMQQLRRNGVAHGDLQHGNILISAEQIFLVDYDGFYVPELSGRQSNELGHLNYQHPQRNESLFGPTMDNFSAWIIYLSLLILIEDPELWDQFGGGDECLLFRRTDYVNPDNSKLIKTLQSHPSLRIREATAKLLELLAMPVEDLPYLETSVFEIEELLTATAPAELAPD